MLSIALPAFGLRSEAAKERSNCLILRLALWRFDEFNPVAGLRADPQLCLGLNEVLLFEGEEVVFALTLLVRIAAGSRRRSGRFASCVCGCCAGAVER